MRRVAALALPVLAACVSRGPQSPYVRVMADTGRVYYADVRTALHSEGGGFLTFLCLVTRESVRLKDGSYRALRCPRSEVDIRQREYMNDPSHKPVVSDYEPEPE